MSSTGSRPGPWIARAPAAALALALWPACTPVPPPVPVGTDLPTLDVPHLEERALMLLLADRKWYDPFTVERIRAVPSLRPELALTIGRAADPRGRLTLEELARDPDAEVRRAAAFGLGLLGDRESERTLLLAVRDADRETGRLAVEALGRLGVSLAPVREALRGLPTAEVEARLLPALFRFEPGEILPVALDALESVDGAGYSWAAYALARRAHQEGAPVLRLLLGDPDPWIRGWAARGLGDVGGASDVAALGALLDDEAPGPVIHALRAAAGLARAGEIAAPEGWVPRLLRLLVDERTGVRMTAYEVAGAWLLNEDLGERLAETARVETGEEARLAVLALAEGGDPRAAAALRRLMGSSGPADRSVAARAATRLADLEALRALSADPEAAVREASLTGLLELEGDAWIGEALDDPDPGVRAAALEWLTGVPSVDAREIVLAMSDPRGGRPHDVTAAGIAALAALARAQPATESEVLMALTTLAEGGGYLVRRDALEALRDLGFDVGGPGRLESDADVAQYEAVVQRTRRPRLVRLETDRGAIDLELDCERAPRTCWSFVQLADQGFYDGLPFHRVVPDFVVQTGDPRGDGRGGPGYTVRDEETRIPFDRGTLGMATDGPDTAGSQFFVTLSRQPHLDGEYTAFGRVVAGAEILDRLERGDRVVAAYEVVEPTGPGFERGAS